MKKGILHLILYLVVAGVAVLSVIKSQGNLLPKIVGIPLYILAAMLLTATFICLYKDLKSGIIEKFFITVKKNAFGAHFLEDYRLRTVLATMPSFVINVAYTIYNGVIGVMNQSAWFITMAVINMVKVRKMQSPILITIRNIGVADALVSMLTLQMTMLLSFQGTDGLNADRMNGITGLAVCLLISALGISMIYYAFKEKELDCK